MVAGEVAAKPKQDFVCLQVENLFSDPVMWHRCIAQVKKKQRKAMSPLSPTRKGKHLAEQSACCKMK